MSRRLLLVGALVGALLVGVALTTSVVRGDHPSGAATPASAPASAPATTSSPAAPPTSSDPAREGDLLVPGRGELAATGSGAEATPTTPVTVRLPSIGVESGLEPLRTDRSGRLRAPEAWQRAGWFAEGTVPGDVGPAVVAGHVDSPTGPAVFARLDELEPGDRVEVQLDDGATAVFAVDRSEVVAKDAFPTASVYGPTPDAQLRLVTCDGPYVRSSGGYQDNLVVYASEVTR